MTSMAPSTLPPSRGNPHRRLAHALVAMAGGAACAAIISAAHEPWASATFQGTRHMLILVLSGEDARARGETLRATLPEAEFRLPGHIVAAIDVDGLTVTADQTVSLSLSALTIEDW